MCFNVSLCINLFPYIVNVYAYIYRYTFLYIISVVKIYFFDFVNYL